MLNQNLSNKLPAPTAYATLNLFKSGVFVLLFSICFIATSFSPRIQNTHAEFISPSDSDNIIDITLLQLNDVYEISPLDSGKSGGLARVAALVKELKSSNRNVYTVLAGDFLFPSALGTIRTGPNRKEIKGMQMVEVMNALPVDMVTFGNHEFDIDSIQYLNERIDHSRFEWVSANVIQKQTRQPFTKLEGKVRKPLPSAKVIPFTNASGKTVRIGIFGLTLGTTETYYVDYTDEEAAIKKSLQFLKDNKADVIIALTHLERKTDTMWAKRFPEIQLFIGGHEHVNSMDTIYHASGKRSFVTKADGNARTAYIHRLRYNTKSRDLAIHSELKPIDSRLAEDPGVKKVVDKWNNWADSMWRARGYAPCKILATLDEPLDGTEFNIRSRSTNLTDLIAKSIYEACDGSNIDASIYNSGSIRIDDSIRNVITQYDIIRTIPYSGKIYVVKLKGFLLRKLLETSKSCKRNGCFLQTYNIDTWGTSWKVNERDLVDSEDYTVAITDYLAKGRQENMTFFHPSANGIVTVDSSVSNPLRADLIAAVSTFIEKHYAKPLGPVTGNNKVPCY